MTGNYNTCLTIRQIDSGVSGGNRKLTALGDFCKCQACTSLKVDVVRVNKGAQGSKGLAREEVGFAALH
jgi:hypothetical protein